VQADALDYLRTIKSDSAGIVFLDPPFNLGKRYSTSGSALDMLPEGEYERWLCGVLIESQRVLMPGGTLYLYHLPRWAITFGASLSAGLEFRHWIAISMKNGFVRGERLYPAHYALLMFTKGAPAYFRRPRLPAPKCRTCGEYVKDYGGYRDIIERQGVNLSDIWDDLSPVRHANRKHRAANELPMTLFERVIGISGSPRMLYVDPFAGSGSGAIAAAKAGLRFACCDLMVNNCRLICRRLLGLGKELERDGKQ
jgi:site-specific DNA-methyltransferase (adenine-specific)